MKDSNLFKNIDFVHLAIVDAFKHYVYYRDIVDNSDDFQKELKHFLEFVKIITEDMLEYGERYWDKLGKDKQVIEKLHDTNKKIFSFLMISLVEMSKNIDEDETR